MPSESSQQDNQGDSANGFAGIVRALAIEAAATCPLPDETCSEEPGSGNEDKGKVGASRASSVSTTASSDRESDGDLSGCAEACSRRRSGSKVPTAELRGGTSCWVVAAPGERVQDILSSGLGYAEARLVAPRSKQLRLCSGPWGRTGVARKGEDVLVYVDVLRAMMEGTELSFQRRGVMLCAGHRIPAHCIRKITRIADGELLHESE